MNTQQINPVETENPQPQTLKDITDEELIRIFTNNYRNYTCSADFIKEYYGFNTSRQAIHKRLKGILAESEDRKLKTQENARKILNEALEQDKDWKLRMQAAKILLNRKIW
jgi:hypothetical protein